MTEGLKAGGEVLNFNEMKPPSFLFMLMFEKKTNKQKTY